MSNLPSSPNPLSNRRVLHDGAKHKAVFSSQPNALCEEARRTNLPLLAISCHADCSGERRTSPLNGIERSLSHAVVIKTSLCPPPLPRFQERCLCTSRTMGESISTIQRSPRISTSSPINLPPLATAAADGLADGPGERRTSPVNGIERSLSRAVQ